MDEVAGVFINLKTGDRLALSDAVEAGFVTAEYENGQDSASSNGTESKTYAVNSIVDQVRAIDFSHAHRYILFSLFFFFLVFS